MPAGELAAPASLALLPLVWSRVLSLCLWVAVAAAPVAASVGGSGVWRWTLAVLVGGAGLFLLERVHRWRTPDRFPALGFVSALAMGLLTADYAFGAVPRLRRLESVRPAGRQIDETALGGDPIAVLQPGFVPFLFYLGSRPVYLQTPGSLPASIHYLLVRQGDLPAVESAIRSRELQYRIALRINDKRLNHEPAARWLLLSLNPASGNSL